MKTKWPRAEALDVAREIVRTMQPRCERLVVAGSLRRRKVEVGDVEIFYIPKFETVQDGLFDTKSLNVADLGLDDLLCRQVIDKRANVNGSNAWGPKNKYAVHLASEIPVDFFQATADNWFNYLVCRTGGSENNIRIASAAQSKGWKWHPYGCGFTNERGEPVLVESEEDVFRLVGLPYLEPWLR